MIDILDVFCRFFFIVPLFTNIISGCPNPHAVIVNQRRDITHEILTDNCNSEQGNEWLAPKGAKDTDAEIIIDIGCIKTVKSLNLKNLKKIQGGTKMFTIFLSISEEGPWDLITTAEFPEEETYGCGVMHAFEFK